MTDLAPLCAFLAAHGAATLATVRDDGKPAAAAVFYAHEGGARLLFLSALETAHGRNMLAHPLVALTVQKDDQDWRTLSGIQMTGHAAPLSLAEREAALSTYLARFPEIAGLEDRVAATPLWRFIPQWARLIDNSREFGHKTEWVF